jgi:hypothetical protein
MEAELGDGARRRKRRDMLVGMLKGTRCLVATKVGWAE